MCGAKMVLVGGKSIRSDGLLQHVECLLGDFGANSVAADDGDSITAAERIVMHENMTISQGALKALNHCEEEARVRGLAAFHDRWQDNALVMENGSRWSPCHPSAAASNGLQS